MTVTIKLFAAVRETIGNSELVMEVGDTDRIIDIWERLVRDYPNLGQWRTGLKFAQNLEFVEPEQLVRPGDEIAFIPPVSGG